jgi:hypothetical protein
VAPIITGIIVHFRFHIRCISIHKHLCFNFFSASFCMIFLSAGIATSISARVFPFLVFNYYIWIFAVTSLSVCAAFLLIFLFFFFLLLLLSLSLSSSLTLSPSCRVFIH